MTQAAPSNLFLAQALKALAELKGNYSLNKNKSPEEITEIITTALSKFNGSIGGALTKYEPISYGEIPRSEKSNRFLSNTQADIHLLQDQIDILKAASIFTHNFIRTEVLKAQSEHSRLQNKLKTLQIYSESGNDSVIYFGDSFINEENIDWNQIGTEQRVRFLNQGCVTLGIANQISVLDSNSSIYIMDGSNGFPGNNQEIEDPTSTGSTSTSPRPFTFKSEKNRAANLSKIIDNNSNTWFEFERYSIKNSDKSQAKDLNFVYKLNKPLDESMVLSDGEDPSEWLWSEASGSGSARDIDWASGVPGNVLKLNLHVDLGSLKLLNNIKLMPFGLVDNSNNPIKVRRVSVSSNNIDWSVINPENVWIANKISNKLSFIETDKVVIGQALWVINDLEVRYIRFEIEQHFPIQCNVGHLYYVPENVVSNEITISPSNPISLDTLIYDTGIPYNNALPYAGLTSSGTVLSGSYSNKSINNGRPVGEILVNQKTIVPDKKNRVAGPIPMASNPTQYINIRNTKVNNLLQKVEFFRGKRWAIGLRDITFSSNQYHSKSIAISKRFNVAGVIDRVAIEADLSIPESYPVVSSWEDSYIKFEISPDDGLTWIPISRIQDDLLEVPEIIAFNDPTPVELRLPGIGYYNTTNAVESLRVKITIQRPSNGSENSYLNTSPILNSYRLKVLKRI